MQLAKPFRIEPSPGPPAEAALALWNLDEARRRTLAYVSRADPDTGEIDEIGAEALDLRPAGHRHSVATLLYHIAVFEMDWLFTDILGRPEDGERVLPGMDEHLLPFFPYPILQPDRAYTPVRGESVGVHLERLKASRAAFNDVVSAMSLDEFRQDRASGDPDSTVAAEWVVMHLCQHEAEHRGQIWEARVAAEKELAR